MPYLSESRWLTEHSWPDYALLTELNWIRNLIKFYSVQVKNASSQSGRYSSCSNEHLWLYHIFQRSSWMNPFGRLFRCSTNHTCWYVFVSFTKPDWWGNACWSVVLQNRNCFLIADSQLRSLIDAWGFVEQKFVTTNFFLDMTNGHWCWMTIAKWYINLNLCQSVSQILCANF